MGFILIEFSKEQIKLVRMISTTEGFCEMFEKNLPTSRTFLEAYEVTERVHEEIFGDRKYSSYSSFSTCRKKKK